MFSRRIETFLIQLKKRKKKKDLLHLKYLCKEEESLNKLSAVLTFHDSLCVNRAYLLVSCN